MKYLKDEEKSKNAVMEIFEKLMHEIPRNDIKNFSSWLYTVSRNYSLMQLRKNNFLNSSFDVLTKSETLYMEIADKGIKTIALKKKKTSKTRIGH